MSDSKENVDVLKMYGEDSTTQRDEFLKARGDVNLSRFQKGVLLTRTIVFPGTFPFWFFCGTFW